MAEIFNPEKKGKFILREELLREYAKNKSWEES